MRAVVHSAHGGMPEGRKVGSGWRPAAGGLSSRAHPFLNKGVLPTPYGGRKLAGWPGFG